MMFNARSGVSVAELIVYIPAAIAAFIACSRHGFRRSSGFIYTLILCIVRIVGAICELALLNNQSSGLLTATVIIDSIGISPLLLATLGMLSRMADQINMSNQSILTIKHFRFVQLLIGLGLILSIVGGTSGSTDANGNVEVETTSKVGVILYIVAFLGLILMCALCMGGTTSVPLKERRVVLAVLVTIPFVLVRLAYSALSVFVHDQNFNIITGSVPIWVAMSVIEEFIVVIIYIVLGFYLDKLSASQQGPIATREWKERRPRRQRESVRYGGPVPLSDSYEMGPQRY